MRKELSKDDGVRKKFTATFSRVGRKINFKGYSEDTILLTNVRDAENEKVVADHVWFTYSKVFETAGLKEGMEISFEARIKQYRKGYINPALGLKRKSVDYRLSHPTKIVRITE